MQAKIAAVCEEIVRQLHAGIEPCSSTHYGLPALIRRMAAVEAGACPGPVVQLYASVQDLALGSPILRNGDLIVGFRMVVEDDEGDHFSGAEVVVGDVPGSPLRPLPGASVTGAKFAFALEGRFFLPLVAMCYHEVRVIGVKPGGKITPVYAQLDCEMRRAIAQRESRAGPFGFKRGCMFERRTDINDPETLAFEDLNAIWDRISESASRMRCMERCRALRRDLMAVAWHPMRHRAWCLEHDDDFAVTSP